MTEVIVEQPRLHRSVKNRIAQDIIPPLSQRKPLVTDVLSILPPLGARVPITSTVLNTTAAVFEYPHLVLAAGQKNTFRKNPVGKTQCTALRDFS